MSRERIRRIAAMFAVLAGLLGLYLHHLAGVQHEEWLERSYLNRWAFRDLPTKRGEICDRRGTPLAWDVPGCDLELRYREFRRRHPVAVALHGANLYWSAREGIEPYRFTMPERMVDACHDLLGVTVGLLGDETDGFPFARSMREYAANPEDVGADLRFYAGSLLSTFTGVEHVRLARVLRDAARARSSDSILQCTAALVRDGLAMPGASLPDLADELDRRFQRRVVDLREVDARLAVARGLDATGLQLFVELEARRQHWRDWIDVETLPRDEREALGDPRFWRMLHERGVIWSHWRDWFVLRPERRAVHLAAYQAAVAAEEEQQDWAPPALADETALPAFRDETRARPLARRLGYEVAAWLGMLAERLPGFELRTSVIRSRARAPGRDDLGGLEPFLGSVRGYHREDYLVEESRTPDRVADDVMADASVSGFLDFDDDRLPDDLEESLRRGAERTLAGHLRVFGRIGRDGVERAMDERLSGRPGLRFIERDRAAREERMFATLDVARGSRVTLTCDLRLQGIADRIVSRLDGALERAMVVMDAHSGDLLALSGRRRVVVDGRIDEVFAITPVYPAGNPAIGSVIKPFVALEYLERLGSGQSVPSPATFAPCVQDYRHGSIRIRCGGHHGHDSQDVVASIARSCNVFFFEASRYLGEDGLLSALQRVGWAPPTVDAAGALVADGAGVYRARLTGVPWSMAAHVTPRQAIPLRTIGYDTNVSTVDVARGYAALAAGAIPEPSLVRERASAPQPLAVSASALRLVREGLRQCIRDGTGDGIREDLRRLGLLEIAHGKSGTALITERRHGADRGLDNAWFALFLGTDADAGLVIVATAYHIAGGGGAVSAPMIVEFLEGVANDPELSSEYLLRSRR